MCAIETIEHASRTESSDSDLKLLARLDRSRAMSEVVRRYGDRLYLHAYYILHDGQEARDVIQEVFIKALREPRFYDPEFKIQAWLYRVTRNLCFNIVRDRRRREHILAANPGDRTGGADPLQAVFNGEQQEEILAAVERLSDDHREILMLRYYEDLSYADIAARLEIKLGTVMSRLSRARDRLLEVIGDETPLRAAG